MSIGLGDVVSSSSSRATTGALTPRVVQASAHVFLTGSGAASTLAADVRTAITATDRSLLARLLGNTNGSTTTPELANLIGTDTDTARPDFVAVRTGSAVTGLFSGGGTISSWTDLGTGTEMTFFATGSPPDAAKGVAITFGAEATPGDRDVQTHVAMAWLGLHLDDQQDTTGHWNRSLIDATF